MAIYECAVCGYMYDEVKEPIAWDELPGDWACPVCGNGKSFYFPSETSSSGSGGREPDPAITPDYPPPDSVEPYLTDIHMIADTGESLIEPMRTRKPVVSWDDILIKGAQLSRIPLDESLEVSLETVVGPEADHPLVIESPVIITHMSFGALSKEAKLALAEGSAAVKTAMSSGEGGILPESIDRSYRYIFEYVPNRYSVTDVYLAKVDAVEIKFGQSAKPGMGGHLPGNKVTAEIAAIRGFSEGKDIISPSHFDDILTSGDLKRKVEWLREKTSGKPIGIKLAAGHIEQDLAFVLEADPDFITFDGRAGATGAAPKFIKNATSIPSMFALFRARKYLDEHSKRRISLILTGGLRISSDFAKAIAMGADAVAIGSSALMAIGCRQYRICHTGRCPMGITTQDPELRKLMVVSEGARRLENFLKVTNEELRALARLTGHEDIHALAVDDLCTTNSEISGHTNIGHV